MPRLVCNATTPQEMRDEIVSLLIHRAKQQTELRHTTNSSKRRDQMDYAAAILSLIAGEIKRMVNVSDGPDALKAEVQP
jgi:hypothetical protein